MRFLIAVLLSIAFVAAPIATADAAKKSKRQANHCDAYCQRYPSANSRQLRNAKAYGRGEYWEQDSNAHPVGSPGWWYLKERDRRGGLPF
jgi:hypothetical protein